MKKKKQKEQNDDNNNNKVGIIGVSNFVKQAIHIEDL